MKAEDQLYDGKKEEDEEEEWEGLLSTRGKSYISYPFDGVDVIRGKWGGEEGGRRRRRRRMGRVVVKKREELYFLSV